MAIRFHHLFLGLISVAIACSAQAQHERPDLNNELFEVGIDAGFLAIQDFNTELAYGVNATFHGSEDFFLQFNYLSANASFNSFELNPNQTPVSRGKAREFLQYGLLLGYQLFAGELYPSEARSTLSNLYIVGGVGNVSFLDEEQFNATLGLGYKLGLSRKLNLRVDYRSHIYETKLLNVDGTSSINNQFTIGLGYLL